MGQDTSKLNDAEYLIIEALQLQKRLKIQEIAQILQRKTVLPFVKKMQEFKLVEMKMRFLNDTDQRFER